MKKIMIFILIALMFLNMIVCYAYTDISAEVIFQAEPFLEYNEAEKLIEKKTDSFWEQIGIALSYGLGNNIGVISDAIIPPYNNSEKLIARFYGETLELVLDEMLEDELYQKEIANQLFYDFNNVIDASDVSIDALEVGFEKFMKNKYGVRNKKIDFKTGSLGDTDKIIFAGDLLVDYVKMVTVESLKYVEMIDSMKASLPDYIDPQLTEAINEFRDDAVEGMDAFIEETIKKTSKEVFEVAFEKGVGLLSSSVMVSVKSICLAGNLALGGSEKSDALLRGLHLRILDNYAYIGFQDAALEEIENPSDYNEKRLIDSFYLVKATKTAMIKNALKTSPSSNQKKKLLDELSAIKKLNHYDVYGFQKNSYENEVLEKKYIIDYTEPEVGEYAMFPMEYLNISQGISGGLSHKTGYAIDITGKDKGSDQIYAPFTGVIKRKYTKNGNAIWLESSDKVHFADGSYDYMTVLMVHDNDISDLSVDQEVKQGEYFYKEGTAGYATGNHVHLEVGRGKFIYPGWTKNTTTGEWRIQNGIHPAEALFVSDSVSIKDDKNYDWTIVDLDEIGNYEDEDEEIIDDPIIDKPSEPSIDQPTIDEDKTTYIYTRWTYYNESKGEWYYTYSENYAKDRNGIFQRLKLNSPLTPGKIYDGNVSYARGKGLWYDQTVDKVETSKTYYTYSRYKYWNSSNGAWYYTYSKSYSDSHNGKYESIELDYALAKYKVYSGNQAYSKSGDGLWYNQKTIER